MFNKIVLMWWKLCIVCSGEPCSPVSNGRNYI